MRLRRTKTLRVYPNPWGVNPSAIVNETPVDHSTLDPEGRPCGVLSADSFTEGGEAKRFVGATICEKHTVVGPSPERKQTVSVGNIWKPRQTTVYAFLGRTANETRPYQLADELAKAEPVTLPYSEYYRAHIASGELIAADEETAKEAGVEFVEPTLLFPELARAAAKAFDSQYNGDTAYEHFVSERAASAAPEATEEPAKSEMARQTPSATGRVPADEPSKESS